MKPFIELVTFNAKPGITPHQVISASQEVNVFLKGQQGFLSRHLGQSQDGTWHDILFWESHEHVMAAMENAASSPHCTSFFGLIDQANDNMALFPALMAISKP